MISQSRFHRRGHPQSLVNTSEIVETKLRHYPGSGQLDFYFDFGAGFRAGVVTARSTILSKSPIVKGFLRVSPLHSWPKV